ncbi:glucose-6-phosphate 1-dehydrogenase 2 [Arthrobacter sp. Hiyo8]|nr:glucose-6-phosphate 1-dehydrogenase 2 [Arthrobacter sp. Hiyo8]
MVFKRAPNLLFRGHGEDDFGQNAVVIRVQPDEGATIRFGSKVPGTQMEVRDVTMDFGYGHSFTESSPEAYERLILDVLLGEPPLFPGTRKSRSPGRSWTPSRNTGPDSTNSPNPTLPAAGPGLGR